MAKPDGYTSGRNIKIEYSDGGGIPVWTDISAFLAEVAPNASDRPTAQTHVAGEDTPFVTVGARQMREVQVTLIYTDNSTHTAGDIYQDILLPAHNAETNIPIRWSPHGGAATESQYSTDPEYTVISSIGTPSKGSIGDAEIIRIDATFVTSEITRSVIV